MPLTRHDLVPVSQPSRDPGPNRPESTPEPDIGSQTRTPEKWDRVPEIRTSGAILPVTERHEPPTTEIF